MKVLQNMWMKMKDKKGFTLIEMIIVIAIIAILIALIAPNLIKYMDTAKQTKVSGAAKTLYTSGNAHLAEMALKNEALPRDEDHKFSTTADWVFGKDFAEAYFNVKEIEGVEATLTVKDGVVTKVSWTQDGNTATYPGK